MLYLRNVKTSSQFFNTYTRTCSQTLPLIYPHLKISFFVSNNLTTIEVLLPFLTPMTTSWPKFSFDSDTAWKTASSSFRLSIGVDLHISSSFFVIHPFLSLMQSHPYHLFFSLFVFHYLKCPISRSFNYLLFFFFSFLLFFFFFASQQS